MRFKRNIELERPDVEQYQSVLKMPVKIVLDNVRSGSNVGSVFRTSDAFAVEELILCGITAAPPEREILKTALGATESVKWSHVGSTLEAIQVLKQSGYSIFAIEQADPSIPLDGFQFAHATKRLALVFGNEVKGVDDSLIPFFDGCIEVPQAGVKHSLNVSVCVGVVLWELYRSFK